MRKNVQQIEKTRQNYAKMRKIVQKIVCTPKKLAQLEKVCSDGVTRVPLFLHLSPEEGITLF